MELAKSYCKEICENMAKPPPPPPQKKKIPIRRKKRRLTSPHREKGCP